MTGATKERPQLNKMLLELEEGDTVYCESISRLGRNLKDLIEIVETLVDKGVRVVIVKEGIDTTTSTYKLLLGIFGAVAEMERETIQERTQQSINALKEIKEETGEIKTKSGKWFGGQEKKVEDLPKDFAKYYNRLKKHGGDLTAIEVSKLLGVGRATFYRWIKLYEENNHGKKKERVSLKGEGVSSENKTVSTKELYGENEVIRMTLNIFNEHKIFIDEKILRKYFAEYGETVFCKAFDKFITLFNKGEVITINHIPKLLEEFK